jgi:hypothetical protein
MEIDCTLCGAKHAMRLVETAYGFTGGDKWQCRACEGYVVTRPEMVPLPQPKA